MIHGISRPRSCRGIAAAASAAALAVAAFAPASAGASPTVVALWHMNETSGTTMVDSAGGHDGTLKNVKIGVPGKSGKAYRFNGSSSLVAVPSAPDLDPGSANMKVTLSIKTTSVPSSGDYDLIRKGASGTDPGWKMELQPSGQASCHFAGTQGVAELEAGPSLDNGAWHTVTCVKTGSAIKTVVDGTAYTKTVTIGAISSTARVILGASPGNDWYKGDLDEASVTIG